MHCMMQRALVPLALLSSMCLTTLVLALPAPTAKGEKAFDHTIMMDAGSSGTRIHIYHWPQGSGCAERIVQQTVVEVGEGMNVSPGLSSFAANPGGIAAYLAPLLEFAAGLIPAEQHADTNIFCFATAGLRLLPEPEQRAVMAAARAAIGGGPFTLRRAEDVEVISGQQEGSHEWMAVNYLLGSLDPEGAVHTAASLGMGGASTQIALTPPANVDLKAGEYELDLAGLPDRELYIHSYLGLGLSSAQGSHWEALHKAQPAESRVHDPCLLRGYETVVSVGTPARDVTFVGGGGYGECMEDIRRTLVDTAAPCPLTPCSFDGVYQPDLGQGSFVVRKEFFGTSSFVFTAGFFGLAENASLSAMASAAEGFCHVGWKEAQAAHPDVPPQFLMVYCFSGTYFVTLLHHGYGVHMTDTPLRWADKINGVALDWPVGAAVQVECTATAASGGVSTNVTGH